MNKIYYSQIDSRWKDYPYPSQELPNATIGSGGCGVASAAMIVSMLKQTILPPAIADKFLKDGIRVNGGTSNKAFDSYITEQYGLKVEKKWELDEAIECLKNGGLVVTRCLASRGKLFTTGGHFIVLVGYNNGVIEVFDPYLYSSKFNTSYRKGKAEIKGTSVFVTYDNMKDYGGYYELWCYAPTEKKDEPTTTPSKSIDELAHEVINGKWGNGADRKTALTNAGYDYSAVQNRVNEILGQATPKTKTAIVTAKSGLNVRSGIGLGYGVIGAIPYNKQVTILIDDAGVANGYTWDKVQYGNIVGYAADKYLN